MKVRVLRPLCVAGKRKEVGEIVDLPFVDAKGAIFQGRAESVEEKPTAAGPMTTQSIAAADPAAEPQPTPKKRRKGAEEPQA